MSEDDVRNPFRVNEIDQRIELVKRGEHQEWLPKEDIWFAWYPVRIGALSTGPRVWLKHVWRDRCLGVTAYQLLSILSKAHLERLRSK